MGGGGGGEAAREKPGQPRPWQGIDNTLLARSPPAPAPIPRQSGRQDYVERDNDDDDDDDYDMKLARVWDENIFSRLAEKSILHPVSVLCLFYFSFSHKLPSLSLSFTLRHTRVFVFVPGFSALTPFRTKGVWFTHCT